MNLIIQSLCAIVYRVTISYPAMAPVQARTSGQPAKNGTRVNTNRPLDRLISAHPYLIHRYPRPHALAARLRSSARPEGIYIFICLEESRYQYGGYML